MLAQESNPAIDSQVKQLLAQMTLPEKVGQMLQIDVALIGKLDTAADIDMPKLEQAIARYHVGSILNTPFTPNNQAQPIEAWRKLQRVIEDASAKSRLKIPILYGIDAIHGATYTQNATLFPQAINMAATFNRDLLFHEGEITAREVKASGIAWNFYPVLDIGRQPLWSRFWETYGEDVHLATVMGSAYIHGHQGEDFSASDKAATCLKHYVGYSYPLNGKDRTPAWIGERVLREYFLPTFAAGVKAGAPSVMINSAEVDGIPGHANAHYLKTILRDELGFKGFTISDWEDIKRLYTRDKMATSPREAVKMAVMAGVDMSMVPDDFSFYELLLDLAEKGDVPLARIDEAVTRILTVKYQTGLFNPQPLPPIDSLARADSTAINQQAARESIVLAKNDGAVLPLKKDARVLVTGATANLLSVLNGAWTITWQGDREDLYPKNKATLLDALRQKAGENIGYVGEKSFDAPIDLATLQTTAADYDYIVLCLGEKPYTEMLGTIESLSLEARQRELAAAAFATGKPVILVMIGGRPRIITEIADKAAAVLLAFLPGMEGGNALADILYGDYNPDAKLPLSYPRDTNAVTPYDYKPMENFDTNRYNPLYPFGHGLSYTTFATSGLHLDKTHIQRGEAVQVSVKVKNTGNRQGKETVLLYLNDVAASVSRPNKQLKGFEKVALEPNEEKQLHFTLTADDLSFIGIDMKRIVEAGEFKVMVGNESASFWLD